MKEQDKQLLLKDLCARLPYGVKCRWESDGFSNEGELTDICHQEGVNGFKYWDGYLNNDGEDIPIEIIKPYLRPMSSMTEEEKKKLKVDTCPEGTGYFDEKYLICPINHYGEHISYEFMSAILEWLNAHHFDYRGLIEKGFALEAPEGMYK